MRVLTTIEAFRAARAEFGGLGLAPTMGFLHEGHLSLARQAKADCGAAAVSIFVNPTQFAPHEDFSRYPRALARDLELLEAEGVDLVFTPDVAEMYPAGFDAKITIGGVTARLEGEIRPEHFAGVATVVTKLFNIVQPSRAYFGQKDAQQCVVVRKLARDLNLPVEIVVGATVREADGLAMSSRNAYLTPDQRSKAGVLYRSLSAAAARHAAGERNAEALRNAVLETLAEVPEGVIDYVSVADPDTLAELSTLTDGALICLAVRFGPTRLIDNVRL